jgi:hypothetical protein
MLARPAFFTKNAPGGSSRPIDPGQWSQNRGQTEADTLRGAKPSIAVPENRMSDFPLGNEGFHLSHSSHDREEFEWF